MEGLTLLLDRKEGDLWITVKGRHVACIWDVTGLERKDKSPYHTTILRKGIGIGGVWYAEEIKEKWG